MRTFEKTEAENKRMRTENLNNMKKHQGRGLKKRKLEKAEADIHAIHGIHDLHDTHDIHGIYDTRAVHGAHDGNKWNWCT